MTLIISGTSNHLVETGHGIIFSDVKYYTEKVKKRKLKEDPCNKR